MSFGNIYPVNVLEVCYCTWLLNMFTKSLIFGDTPVECFQLERLVDFVPQNGGNRATTYLLTVGPNILYTYMRYCYDTTHYR